MFGVITLIMKAAPLGAFGAMGRTVGAYGPQSLGKLATLVATFQATSAVFVFVVLGIVARLAGFSIPRLPDLEEAVRYGVRAVCRSLECPAPGLQRRKRKPSSPNCAPPPVRLKTGSAPPER